VAARDRQLRRSGRHTVFRRGRQAAPPGGGKGGRRHDKGEGDEG
jgi:hypothetical protein